MATTTDKQETGSLGRWAMRVEVAPSDQRGPSLSLRESDDRSHALAAWLLDEWKREQAGRGGER